jgi:hypothetical protein
MGGRGMKISIMPLITLVTMFLLLAFSRFRWDIVIRTHYIVGTISSIVIVCAFIGSAIYSVAYAIFRFINKKWRALIPLFLVAAAYVHVLYFAYTPIYARIEYKANKNMRNQVIKPMSPG